MNVCKQCKKETNNPKFCNSSCAAKYNNNIRYAHRPARRNKNGKTHWSNPKYCNSCGKELVHGQYKYCSLLCQQILARKDTIKRFLNDEYVGKELNSSVRKYLLSVADNKCSKCGWSETHQVTGKIPLEVHHIDGNWKNNTLDNIQILCPNCHSLTDTHGILNKGNGRRKYRELYHKEKAQSLSSAG